ncbi:uncharacterized protein A4U43_UnF5800 [Asparagus officinalis]|uniref:Uncharacterized protein n=1 Tax=Asparagus officinalis TaxID=4686 RepID=A0A1R3L6M9_ASPOF|nr:uncharacterized protein A4U43_UnF5800 [Asparagus officinalis]
MWRRVCGDGGRRLPSGKESSGVDEGEEGLCPSGWLEAPRRLRAMSRGGTTRKAADLRRCGVGAAVSVKALQLAKQLKAIELALELDKGCVFEELQNEGSC